jgi:signal transduction histidine kinase
MEELRELSQGIRPAVLVERGLGAALDDLARRATVPVRLDVQVDHALSSDLEAAAYFVASEALANVSKHSHASGAEILLSTSESTLRLEIADDGIGGAAAGGGSGLRGLTDRVEALGGTVTVSSPIGLRTRLVAELPCA